MNPSPIFTFTERIAPGSAVIRLDASLLKKAFCAASLSFTLKGLKPVIPPEPYLAGTAVHAYISKRRDMLPAVVEAGKIYSKHYTDTKMIQNLCSAYPDNLLPPAAIIDGKPAEEFYFEIPWLETMWNGKHYTIVICGTMDHLSFTQGYVRIYDYKTTKKWKFEEAAESYDNDAQFVFYPWVVWKFGHVFLPLEMHNAAREFKLSSTPVIGMMVPTPASGISKRNPSWRVAEHKTFTEEIFNDFEMEIRDLVEKMLGPYLTGAPANRDGWIKNLCPRCDFAKLCHARDENMYEMIKSRLFYVREHDPRQHGKSETV